MIQEGPHLPVMCPSNEETERPGNPPWWCPTSPVECALSNRLEAEVLRQCWSGAIAKPVPAIAAA